MSDGEELVHGAQGRPSNVRQGGWGLGVMLALTGMLGCAAPGPAPTLAHDGQAEAAVPAALGEARSPTAPLRVRVLEARQVSAGALQMAIELAHVDASSGAQESLEEAARALAGLSVLTSDRRRRLFPLRTLGDAAVDQAPAAPPPGGTTTFRVLFASDPPAQGPLTLLLPGFAPIAGIPVS